jgi:hypothetical protein
MSILNDRSCPKMLGALMALAFGLSLAATGSAPAQRFDNAHMASSNGAEILTGFPHSVTRAATSGHCAAPNGAEILGGFKSGEIIVCR